MLCARTPPQSRDCVRVRSFRLGASPLRCVPLRRRYSARGARRTDGRLSVSSSAPRRVPPVDAVFARACAPPGSVGIPPVAIRRAFAAHPASRAVRGACLLLAVLRVLCAIGSAVLLRCGRETPAPTRRHMVRFAQGATTEIYTLSLHDALPISIRRAFAAHPASRAVRVACLLLAVLRVLCAIGPAVLLRCRRETPAPTHRHYIRFAPSWRKTLGEAAPRRFALVKWCG